MKTMETGPEILTQTFWTTARRAPSALQHST